MRGVFAGGGTAGHLSPALAVAQRFLRQAPEAEALFLAARRPLDQELMAQHSLNHRLLSVTGLPYGLSWKTITALARLGYGACEAWQTYGQWRPEVVFGAGGYVSAAAVPPAAWRHIPVVIHVSDAQPDRTNLKLARFAQVITVAFAAAAEYFPADRTFVTGQPVREEILATDRETARQELGYGADDFVLLVTGGSQGARRLNLALVGALPALDQAGVRAYHLAGNLDYDEVTKMIASYNLSRQHICKAYETQMELALAAADLVLMRAGSSSLAEAAAWGLPMLLVPYPHAGGHQHHNAVPLAQAGAALLVDDGDVNAEWLVATVLGLQQDRNRRMAMAAAAQAWGSREAADRIAEHLVQAGSSGS